VAIWHSKTFWQRAEWVATLVTACSAVFTLVLEWKTAGALVTVLGAGCVFLARWRVAAIEEQARQRQAQLARRVVLRILESLHDQYFSKALDTERHHHRVTLFVCQPGNKQGDARRLIIYARSGPYEQSTAHFSVDDNRPEACEGVVGQIWFFDMLYTPHPLPAWPDSEHDQTGHENYAQPGFLTRDKARTLNVKARTFSGVTVWVRGEKWGVLLLDSRGTALITKRKEYVVERFGELLGKILEELLP
jgi:hypothetical protein